jgi:hypothetical protein
MAMSMLDALIASAREGNSRGTAPTFVLQRGADEVRQSQAVFAWFADDEDHQQLDLAVDGAVAGVLAREDVLALVGSLDRGAGAGEHLILPGDPADVFIRVRCAVPGCPRSWLAGSRTVAREIRCDDHPAVPPDILP